MSNTFALAQSDNTVKAVEGTIASASTTDLSTVPTSKVVITGSTTITSFGSAANCLRYVRFGSSLVLTYNATSLVLPGAASILTSAGDTAVAGSDAFGNWRIYAYTKADGTAVGVVADVSSMANSNLLINGFHNISQELGTSSKTVTNSVGYITDQNVIGTSTNVGASGQLITTPFGTQPDIPFGLKVQITTAAATLSSGDYIQVYQPLEGINLARLLYGSSAARAVTVAFMAKSSISTVAYFSLRSLNSSGTPIRSYLNRFSLAANTDTFVYLQIPGDTAQALLTTNAASMQAMWSFGAGSTYQGSSGSWLAGNYCAGSDVTNLAASTANNVIISGAVLIPGLVPINQTILPLLSRRYEDDFRLSQRYFETGNYSVIGNGNQGACQYGTWVKYQVQKRASATVSFNSTSNTNVQTYGTDTATPDGFRFYAQTNQATTNSQSQGTFTASARM